MAKNLRFSMPSTVRKVLIHVSQLISSTIFPNDKFPDLDGPRTVYMGADKSLARPTSRCILFDGENISFDASLVILVYTNSTNIPPIMIISRIYETQYLLSL